MDSDETTTPEPPKSPMPTHDATCKCVICAMANREIALLERVFIP